MKNSKRTFPPLILFLDQTRFTLYFSSIFSMWRVSLFLILLFFSSSKIVRSNLDQVSSAGAIVETRMENSIERTTRSYRNSFWSDRESGWIGYDASGSSLVQGYRASNFACLPTSIASRVSRLRYLAGWNSIEEITNGLFTMNDQCDLLPDDSRSMAHRRYKNLSIRWPFFHRELIYFSPLYYFKPNPFNDSSRRFFFEKN